MQNAVEEARAEERQNSREAVATAREKTKEEMMKYVDGKQKVCFKLFKLLDIVLIKRVKKLMNIISYT